MPTEKSNTNTNHIDANISQDLASMLGFDAFNKPSSNRDQLFQFCHKWLFHKQRPKLTFVEYSLFWMPTKQVAFKKDGAANFHRPAI